MLSTILLIIFLLYIIADWESTRVYVIPLLILVVVIGVPALIVSIYRTRKKEEEANRELYEKMRREEEQESSRLAEIERRVAAFKAKYGKPDMVIPSTCSEPRFFALFAEHNVLVINNIEIPFSDIVSCELKDEPEYLYDDDDVYDDDVELEKDYSTGPFWCAQDKVVDDVWREPKQHRDRECCIVSHHYTLYATLNYPKSPKISIEIGDDEARATKLKNMFRRIIKNNKQQKPVQP